MPWAESHPSPAGPIISAAGLVPIMELAEQTGFRVGSARKAFDGGTKSCLLALDNLATCRRVGRRNLRHIRLAFQDSLLEKYFVGQQAREVEAALCAFNDIVGSFDRDVQCLLALSYEFTNLAVRLGLEPNAVYSVRQVWREVYEVDTRLVDSNDD